MPVSPPQHATAPVPLSPLPQAATSASSSGTAMNAHSSAGHAAQQPTNAGQNTQQQQRRPARVESRHTPATTPNSASTPGLALSDRLWPRIMAYGSNISLVILGIGIAVLYGQISRKQNNQNLMATLWRDCVDLPVPFYSISSRL